MPKNDPTPPRKARPAKGTSARFQLCALLMARGDLTREELLANVSADRTAFSNAVYNGKRDGHITFIGGKYHVTAAGKEWTSGGANLANQQGFTSNGFSPGQVKRSRRQPREASSKLPEAEKQRLGVVDVAAVKRRKKPKARRNAVRVHRPGVPAKPQAATPLPADSAANAQAPAGPINFRCAAISDGGFFLEKDGMRIELTHAEHAYMLRYQERMCEAPA